MSKKFEQQEKGKFKLVELKCLEDYEEVRRKNEKVYAGLKKVGVEFPQEIQGKGSTDYEKREFRIYYPKGDVFASYAVTIHELGHLREYDAGQDPEFLAQEGGAWQRGLERVKKYKPEILELLEKKFIDYKREGKLTEFNDFLDYFDYISRAIGRTVEFVAKYKDGDFRSEKTGELLGKDILGDELTNKFFTQPETWRVGENIDQREIEFFIQDVVAEISDENYED